MKYLDLELKNPSIEIGEIKLVDFLEDKVISLFVDEKKIHQKDLANMFCQKARFNQWHLWVAVDRLIERGLLIRQPRSSYFVLQRAGGVDH